MRALLARKPPAPRTALCVASTAGSSLMHARWGSIGPLDPNGAPRRLEDYIDFTMKDVLATRQGVSVEKVLEDQRVRLHASPAPPARLACLPRPLALMMPSAPCAASLPC